MPLRARARRWRRVTGTNFTASSTETKVRDSCITPRLYFMTTCAPWHPALSLHEFCANLAIISTVPRFYRNVQQLFVTLIFLPGISTRDQDLTAIENSAPHSFLWNTKVSVKGGSAENHFDMVVRRAFITADRTNHRECPHRFWKTD